MAGMCVTNVHVTKGLPPILPRFEFGYKMEPVPKVHEPTLPPSTAGEGECESSDTGRVEAKEESALGSG